MLQGKHYDDVQVGDSFGTALTITETHLVLAAGLFGDFNPLHVNQQHAVKTRFGARILHGAFTAAFLSAPIGMYFYGTAIAFVEQNCRFTHPVRVGDTLTATWRVSAKEDKPNLQGGLVILLGEGTNQQNEVVVVAEGKILVEGRSHTRE